MFSFIQKVPVVKEVQKIVHVDRPVIQEKIVEKQVIVDTETKGV